MPLLYASDLITQYLPWYYLVQLHLRRFQLPYWVPDLYSTGYPLLAEGETGVLSPINALILFLFPFSYAVTLLYLTYALIAVSGTYCFLCRHRLTKISSLLGGLIFTFSGFMVSRYFQPSIIFSAALLPWGMLAVHRQSWWLPLIIYLQVTAGHLQIALISAMAYAFYAFTHLRLYALVLILLGLGLSAVQLLPSVKLYQLSDRRSWDPMVRFTYSLPPAHLLTYISPKAFGISAPGDNLGFRQFGGSFWEFNLTIWTLPFLLSLLPLFLKRSPAVWILYGLWVLFLILSFGGYTPLYRLLARSPEFPFRAPSRFLLIPTFAAAALAAHGFNQLARRRQFLGFGLILVSIVWQATDQLRDYFLISPSWQTLTTLTSPLLLSQTVNPALFVVKFHQGLIITLLSFLILLYAKNRFQKLTPAS